MCMCSDGLAVQDCEMHYMNAWLKRCVFNLDLNRESVSERVCVCLCVRAWPSGLDISCNTINLAWP